MSRSTVKADNGGPRQRVLLKPEVCERVGLSFPTIWKLMREDKFPRSRVLGDQKVCWIESEIEDWINALPQRSYKSREVA
jgi:prophage regulatory protein